MELLGLGVLPEGKGLLLPERHLAALAIKEMWDFIVAEFDKDAEPPEGYIADKDAGDFARTLMAEVFPGHVDETLNFTDCMWALFTREGSKPIDGTFLCETHIEDPAAVAECYNLLGARPEIRSAWDCHGHEGVEQSAAPNAKCRLCGAHWHPEA